VTLAQYISDTRHTVHV